MRIISLVVTVILAVIVVLSVILYLWSKTNPSFIVWHSYPKNSPQIEYIEKIALPEVEKRDDCLAVKAVFVSADMIHDELRRAQDEGRLPDVVFLDEFTMSVLSQTTHIPDYWIDTTPSEKRPYPPFPIEPLLSDWNNIADLSLINNTIVGMIDGKRIGVPINVSMQVLLYNPELLSAAGVAPPTDLVSFWSTIETITANNNAVAGFLLPEPGLPLLPFLWSEGGDFVSEDRLATGVLNDGRNNEIFEKLAAAFEDGQIVLADWREEASSLYAQFAEGKTAMTIVDKFYLDAFTERYPDFEFKTAPFPAGSAGSVAIINCDFLCLTTTANMDVAAAFLEIVLSSEEITHADPRIPVSKEALDNLAHAWDTIIGIV